MMLLDGLEFTFTTSEKLALAPLASDEMVQLIAPVPPIGGVAQLKAPLLFCASDTNVVWAGTLSTSETLWAVPGPDKDYFQ